jgi:hypothetical protein
MARAIAEKIAVMIVAPHHPLARPAFKAQADTNDNVQRV